MRVYIVRHGEDTSVWPSAWKWIPVTVFDVLLRRKHNTRLTPAGDDDARTAAKTLARLARQGEPIAALYTSPYRRARATARIIGRHLGLRPRRANGLREIAGRGLTPTGRREPVWWLRFLSRALLFWPWGHGESWYAGFARARRAWRELTADQRESVVIVSHHWLIDTLLLYLRLNPRWRIIRHDTGHAGISIAERTR